jgi:beta-glucosidase/6-phospho-beta-glucosidase/beta-galactosidase
LLVVGSLAFVGIVAAILVSSADSGPKQTPAAKAKAKAKAHAKAVAQETSTDLKVGKVVVQNTGFPTAVNLPTKRAVMSATQRYFNYAIQDPLRGGRVNN